MNYKSKLASLKEIVNHHISYFTTIDPTIITTINSFILPNTQLFHFNSDNTTFDKIFNLKAENQKQIDRRYFHYKSFDIAYKFVEENYVTASALSNFNSSTDDVKEYEHFFEVIKIPYEKNFIDEAKR